MIIKTIKIIAQTILFTIICLAVYIVWINLTPGHYQRYGCCDFGYMTDKQVEEIDIQREISCIAVLCRPNSPSLRLFLEKFDFNK